MNNESEFQLNENQHDFQALFDGMKDKNKLILLAPRKSGTTTWLISLVLKTLSDKTNRVLKIACLFAKKRDRNKFCFSVYKNLKEEVVDSYNLKENMVKLQLKQGHVIYFTRNYDYPSHSWIKEMDVVFSDGIQEVLLSNEIELCKRLYCVFTSHNIGLPSIHELGPE